MLTVGELREFLRSIAVGDDSPVSIEIGDCGAAACRVWVQASDAVPVDMGGTDPEFEDTRAVLIITGDGHG